MLLSIVKRREIQSYGHVSCNDNSLSLAKIIMHGRVPGKRGRGRPRKTLLSNIHEWTNLYMTEAARKAADSKMWIDTGRSNTVHLGHMATDLDDNDDDATLQQLWTIMWSAFAWS